MFQNKINIFLKDDDVEHGKRECKLKYGKRNYSPSIKIRPNYRVVNKKNFEGIYFFQSMLFEVYTMQLENSIKSTCIEKKQKNQNKQKCRSSH